MLIAISVGRGELPLPLSQRESSVLPKAAGRARIAAKTPPRKRRHSHPAEALDLFAGILRRRIYA